MTKLLFIKASPRDRASKSVAIAEAYLAASQAVRPALRIDTIDLWTEDLPPFDGDRANAKLNVITGASQSDEQQSAWDQIVAIAMRFIEADEYVFAVPMWNGGIPYRLKQYIDIVHQPGLTFGLDGSTGYIGLLKNKRATLVYTSGAFSPAAPSPAFGVDHHSTYLRSWLNQAGVMNIREIRFQPTLLSPDAAAGLAAATAEAEALGRGDVR